jgi:hypothetical protein
MFIHFSTLRFFAHLCRPVQNRLDARIFASSELRLVHLGAASNRIGLSDPILVRVPDSLYANQC